MGSLLQDEAVNKENMAMQKKKELWPKTCGLKCGYIILVNAWQTYWWEKYIVQSALISKRQLWICVKCIFGLVSFVKITHCAFSFCKQCQRKQ